MDLERLAEQCGEKTEDLADTMALLREKFRAYMRAADWPVDHLEDGQLNRLIALMSLFFRPYARERKIKRA